MNEITTTQANLPDTIEDLSKFVLINEERVQALRAQIRAIKKVNVAREVYEQKLAEAQEIGQVTVEAAQKMGELLLQIQTSQGKRTDITSSAYHEEVKTKTEITSEMGMTKDQVSQYQQMAQNPEAVQAAIQKALDNGDVVSRTQVMKEIRAVKEEAQREIEKLKNRPPEIREVVKQVTPPDYAEAKSKAMAFDSETRKLSEKLQKSYNERNELQAQIRELKEKTAGENLRTRVMEGALFFIAGCGGFVRDYGGYIWITDHLAELDETERRNYEWAIRNVHAWSEKFIEALNNGKAKMLEVNDE